MPGTTNIPLQFLNLWLTLLLIWLIANGSLASDIIIAGVVISMVIALAFSSFARVYSVIRWSPKVVVNYLLYPLFANLGCCLLLFCCWGRSQC